MRKRKIGAPEIQVRPRKNKNKKNKNSIRTIIHLSMIVPMRQIIGTLRKPEGTPGLLLGGAK